MKKGDFVEIDFVGRLETTGEVFDLTSEEDARKEGIYNPKQKYKPSLVVIGSNMAVPGVEKSLEHMQVGDEKEFSVPPGEAFGQRDMKMIRIFSMSKFIKEKISPVPGMFVDIDGMRTKVLSVAGGRVRVDFNHPLAGKTLLYKVKVVRQLTDTEEKAQSLLSYYGIKCEVKIDGHTLNIETDKPMSEFLKKFSGENVMKWIPEIKSVAFSDKEAAKSVSEHDKKAVEKAPEKAHENQEHAHPKKA
jgi:FKBP-type peptidyl-prolyl cis-trans isomerase 2